jgi:hypothetical protein
MRRLVVFFSFDFMFRCFIVARALLLFFFAKEKRWERDCDDEPRLSRGGMSSDVRARSLLLSLSLFFSSSTA